VETPLPARIDNLKLGFFLSRTLEQAVCDVANF
jgi:hypothetical protein